MREGAYSPLPRLLKLCGVAATARAAAQPQASSLRVPTSQRLALQCQCQHVHNFVLLCLPACLPARLGWRGVAWRGGVGVAEGLRLSARACEPLSRSAAWMVVSKPPSPTYTHAGMLLAMGLSGQLERLTWTDLYRCAHHHQRMLRSTLQGARLAFSTARGMHACMRARLHARPASPLRSRLVQPLR